MDTGFQAKAHQSARKVRLPHDGNDWDHDLQCHVEAGGWHTVTLTLTGTPPFVEAWTLAFAGATDD
jgi:hypothetical protein